jgi:hypothetical protein
MSDELVQKIDALVGPRNRGQFLEEAAAEKLQRLRRVEAFERVVGSVADGEIPEWETRESTAEWLRSLRQEWETIRSSTAANS